MNDELKPHSMQRTVHEDVSGGLTEGDEGDVDEPQRLVDHLRSRDQSVSQSVRPWSMFLH